MDGLERRHALGQGSLQLRKLRALTAGGCAWATLPAAGVSVCPGAGSGQIMPMAISCENGVKKCLDLEYCVAKKDLLTEEPVELKDYTGTMGEAGGTYYEFGNFPQTESQINKYSEVPVYNGWYLGSDGYFYAKVKENAYKSGYKYSNGTDVAQSSANSYKYFKVEPIKWRVLTDNYNGKKLLLSENILINHMYAESSNNYENSEIRTYLNGSFWNTAFTASAKSMIDDETDVDNSATSTNPNSNPRLWDDGTNDYTCSNTIDKIFLLSEKEVTTADYGFTECNVYGVGNSRIRMTTDFAKASGAWQSTTADCGGWWWLRSPSFFYGLYARHVGDDGNAFSLSSNVSNTEGGVCPALCLKN